MKRAILFTFLLIVSLSAYSFATDLKGIFRDGLVGGASGAIGTQIENPLLGAAAGAGTGIVGGAVLDTVMGTNQPAPTPQPVYAPAPQVQYVDREVVKYVDRPVEKIVYVDKPVEKIVYVEPELDKGKEPRGNAYGYWKKRWQDDSYSQGYRQAMKDIQNYCQSKL